MTIVPESVLRARAETAGRDLLHAATQYDTARKRFIRNPASAGHLQIMEAAEANLRTAAINYATYRSEVPAS